jgi:hypothetical protein
VEFFDQSWTNPGLQHHSPNILALIHQFNTVSCWVASSVVLEDKLRVRYKLFEKFIHVAKVMWLDPIELTESST